LEEAKMKVHQIKCSSGHRLFDVIEGSNLRVKIKCNNKKICPDKARCKREIEVVFGEQIKEKCEPYKRYNCPACKKRLFDATKSSRGIVQIKCSYCKEVADISIGINS
jgi:hypothetical protein